MRGYRLHLISVLFTSILMIFCAVSAIYTFKNVDKIGYEYLYILPLNFLFMYIFFYKKILFKNANIFLMVFFQISFFRYVILPFLIVLSGHYGGRSLIEPQNISYEKAILLMNYELIASSVYIYFLDRKKVKIQKKSFQIKDNWYYFAIFILSLLILLLDRNIIEGLSFIKPTATRKIDQLPLSSAIFLNLFMIIKSVFSCNLLLLLFNRYRKQKKIIYIYISLILIVLDISIYMGTNRSKIIIPGIIYCMLLYKFYGKTIIKYLIILIILISTIVFSVSSYRENAKISENKIVLKADTLQVYTGGVYNVAIAIETEEYYPEVKRLSVLFFDIFRPMIGINMLIKDLPFSYSNIYFNKRIWLNVDRRSQIIPIIGQGYIFFGNFLSPLLLLIFIKIAYIIDKLCNETKDIGTYFILNLILARIGFIMGQNTMNIINYMSILLFIYIVIYLIKLILSKITK